MNNLKRYTLYYINAIDILTCIVTYYFSYILVFHLLPGHVMREALMIGDYKDILPVVITAYVIADVAYIYKDSSFLRRRFKDELIEVLRVAMIIFFLTLTYFYFAKISMNYSRLFLGIYAVSFWLVDVFFREVLKKYLLPKYRKSKYAEGIVLIAGHEDADKLISSFKASKDWRYYITGIVLSDSDKADTEKICGIPVLSGRADLSNALNNVQFDSFLVKPGRDAHQSTQDIIHQCRPFGKKIQILTHEYDLGDLYHYSDQFAGHETVSYLDLLPMAKRQSVIKSMVNGLLALALMPVLLVLMLVVSIFNLESPGRLFIGRICIGKSGRRYYQYRFRVLRMDAAKRTAEGKSPYTMIGRFLSATHMDGMPQLFNILSGEMSFVGRKPVSLPQLFSLGNEEKKLLGLKPGVTGRWNLSDDQAAMITEETASYQSWSFLYDLKILLETVFRYLSLHSKQKEKDLFYIDQFEQILRAGVETTPYVYDSSVYTPKSGAGYTCYLFVKRLLDIVISAAAIVILSPLLLILMFLVIADDGGTPFYAHKRIGWKGKQIKVYKFRSMRKDAGDLEKLLTKEQREQYLKEFKIDNDPRITKIGSFLRRTSLDELPQLFNILGGSLSLVGPRPVTEQEVEMYGKDAAEFLSVKPGLTGYWQAYARNNATYETGERQRMELHYVENQSLLFDIRIFFHTFSAVISEKGAK